MDWEIESESEAPKGGEWEIETETPVAPRRGGTRREAQAAIDASYGRGKGFADPRRLDTPDGQALAKASRDDSVRAKGRADKPFADKLEAIDDAVDRIELGADPAQVFQAFQAAGVSREEIIARGKALGGKAFQDQQTQAVEPGQGRLSPMAKYTGTISRRDTTQLEGLVNTFVRAKEQLGMVFDVLGNEAGLLPDEALARRIARRSSALGAAAPDEANQAGQQAIKEAGKQGWGELAKALVANPRSTITMLADATLQSLPQGAISGAALAINPVLGTGVAGATSTATEYSNTLIEAMTDAGMNPRDPQSVLAALQNKELMANARARGLKRGLAVGAFDALSAGLAGRFMAPAVQAQAGKGALARAAAIEGGIQAGAGAAGEAAGQLADKGKIDDRAAIAMEALAEVPGGAMEVAGGVRQGIANSPGNQLGKALAEDVSSIGFERGSVDEYARRALSPEFYEPGKVLAQWTAQNLGQEVSPAAPAEPVAPTATSAPAATVMPLAPEAAGQETVPVMPAVTVEAQQTTPLTPDQVVGMKAANPVTNGAEALSGKRKESDNQSQSPALDVIPELPRGSLVADSEARLRANAEALNGSPSVPGPVAAGAGAAGGAEPVSSVAAAGQQPASNAGVQPAAGGAVATGSAGVPGRDGDRQPAALNQDGSAALAAYTDPQRLREMGLRAQKQATSSNPSGRRAGVALLNEVTRRKNLKAPSPQLIAAMAPMQAALRQLDSTTTLVPYSDTSRTAADGFSDEGNYFVNMSRPEKSIPMTAWHEFTHVSQARAKSAAQRQQRGEQLSQQDQDHIQAQQLLDEVWAKMSDSGKRRYAEKYLARGMTLEQVLADPAASESLRFEMQSDFMGRRATDRTFLEGLAKDHPTLFGGFIRSWIEVLDTMISALRGRKSDSGGVKNVDRYLVGHLEEARKIAGDVLALWQGAETAPRNQQAAQAPAAGPAQPSPAITRETGKTQGEAIDSQWSAFTRESGTLGIPRDEMPQIKAEHRGALVNFLNARGVEHEQVEVSADSLKPTQREFSPAKVQQAKDYKGGERSILISSDNHVVDGHHQWLGSKEQGEPVKAIRLKAPIKKLLGLVKEFPSAEVSDGAGQRASKREYLSTDAMLAEEYKDEPETFADFTYEEDKGEALTKADIEKLQQELADEQTFAQPAKPQATGYVLPSDEAIKAAGILAESVYAPLPYEKVFVGEKATITFTGNRSYSFVVNDMSGSSDPKLRDTFRARPQDVPDLGAGYDLGTYGLSKLGAKAWNRRVAASLDLAKRGFDLYTAVPKKARESVADVWKAIAKAPGAFEYRKAEYSASAPTLEKIRQVAGSMLKGTRLEATVERISPSLFSVELADNVSGVATAADIEYIGGKDPRMVMHTQDMERGSGMGKAFYQVAFAVADAIGVRVDADPNGLTGTNTYRRTEQMMSAAARAGSAGAVNPGLGQRIYGWNRQAKTAEQKDRNMVRLALAAARNAAEFVPEVVNMTYDPASDSFSFRKGLDGDANAVIAEALQEQDVRVVSISRSTLARAAITWAAIDGAIKASDIGTISKPVLYSRRVDEEAQPASSAAKPAPEYAAVDPRFGPGYKRLDGKRLQLQVRIADTGEVVNTSMDAAALMRDLDEREAVLRELMDCL